MSCHIHRLHVERCSSKLHYCHMASNHQLQLWSHGAKSSAATMVTWCQIISCDYGHMALNYQLQLCQIWPNNQLHCKMHETSTAGSAAWHNKLHKRSTQAMLVTKSYTTGQQLRAQKPCQHWWMAICQIRTELCKLELHSCFATWQQLRDAHLHRQAAMLSCHVGVVTAEVFMCFICIQP